MTTIHVSLVNRSTLFADSDLQPLANAMQIAASRDFQAIWGVDVRIYFTPSTHSPSPDHWAITLLDDPDQANALGYHDVTAQGLPLAKIFVRTTLADGSLVSVTVTHELWEMLADERVNLIVQVGSILYAYENADAVEADADGYDVEIPAGWVGAGTKIRISNFVTKAWFQPGSNGPFDFMKLLTAALELRPGGYIGFMDLNNLRAGWQQKDARVGSAASRVRLRPHLGSRRLLRSIDIDDRVRSEDRAVEVLSVPAAKEA